MNAKNYASRDELVIEPSLAMITLRTDEGPMIVRMNRGFEAIILNSAVEPISAG